MMTGSNKAADRLLALAAEAQQAKEAGNEKAALAQAGATISDTALTAMQERGIVDKETSEYLGMLEGAREDIKTDAFARRAWLRGEIHSLAGQQKPEPNRVLALIFASLARKLPNGQPAIPLLAAVRRDEAKKYGRNTFVLPRGEREHGKIVVNGMMHIVPKTGADTPTLLQLKGLCTAAAELLAEQAEGESLPDLRKIVWLALFLVPRSKIVDVSALEGNFENVKEDLLTRKQDNRIFDHFEFSEKQTLLIEHTNTSSRLVRQLRALQEHAEKFWNGELDVAADINEVLATESAVFISPKDFLANLPGLCAVTHTAWKPRRDKDDTISIVALFERRSGDNAWRWVFCNPEGVKALFDGRRLSFHDWTKTDVPSYVQTFLKQAKPLQKGPEA